MVMLYHEWNISIFLGAYEQTVKYVAGCKLSFRLFAGVSHRGILPLAISEC